MNGEIAINKTIIPPTTKDFLAVLEWFKVFIDLFFSLSIIDVLRSTRYK